MKILVKPKGRPAIEVNWPTERDDEISFLVVAQRAVEHHDKGGSGLVLHLTSHPGEILLPYEGGKIQNRRWQDSEPAAQEAREVMSRMSLPDAHAALLEAVLRLLRHEHAGPALKRHLGLHLDKVARALDRLGHPVSAERAAKLGREAAEEIAAEVARIRGEAEGGQS